MALEISVGDPPVDGRYVVFCPCAALAAREFCEPAIATWHGGQWHYWRPVVGWIGPLPVVRVNEATAKLRAAEQEYDL